MKTTFLRGVGCLLLGLGFSWPLAAADKTEKPAARAAQAGKVDINTAEPAALEALPEIGTDLANAIIAARPFKSVDDLERVSGIGPVKMKTLRNKVVASPVKETTGPKPDRYSSKTASKPAAVNGGEAKDRKEVTARHERGTPPAPAAEKAGAPTGRASADRPRDASGRFISRADAAQRVDINSATKEELEALPEIGPVKAQAIIDARPFSSPEDVMRVSGIKEATYEAIKDRIIVGRSSNR